MKQVTQQQYGIQLYLYSNMYLKTTQQPFSSVSIICSYYKSKGQTTF